VSFRDSLSHLLSDYRPEGAAEASSLERVRELVARAQDPFTRDVPDHVTASAVIARPDGSAFLLVHHRRLDRWLQPGGHVEPDDDSVLATALREAREETGVSRLRLPIGGRILDLDVHPIPRSGNRPAHVHYDIRHLATTEENPNAIAADEIRDARWFTLEEALASGADESLARALRKAQALLAPKSPP
jgi:8-oxo-dGTP pyrophosphatase MutT (NUDIX family)